MRRVSALVIDKTGTLTKNKLEIVSVKEYDPGFSEVLSSLEKGSDHPIAKAIVQAYPDGKTEFDRIEQISAKGLVAHKDGDVYYAGTKEKWERLTDSTRTWFNQCGIISPLFKAHMHFAK